VFRVVHAPVFLCHFASDRRHVKDSDGTWIAQRPPYEPIAAKGKLPSGRLEGYDAWKRTSAIATPFDFDQAQSVRPKGHCVVVRVTSKDPNDGFKPAGGKVQSRALAIANMVLGLKEMIHIREKILTNIDYTIDLLNVSEYRDNKIHTGWLDSRIAMRVRAERPPWYHVYCSLNGSGIGIVLVTPSNDSIEKAIKLNFESSNNEVEYEALIYGLDLALGLGVPQLAIFTDSQLIQRQYTDKNQENGRMAEYAALVHQFMNSFPKNIFDNTLPLRREQTCRRSALHYNNARTIRSPKA
ncbi:hypothetical protein GIB67_030611, partial [Kingdonia uniflora]